MDLAAQQDKGDAEALVAALQAQASEAQAAGGWAAAISASVRPLISYWLMGIYTVAKVATLWMSTQSGVPFAQAVVAAYSSFDGALLGSIVSFWFADRSLRKLR
jgi:FtsH-binding integral membrane protein